MGTDAASGWGLDKLEEGNNIPAWLNTYGEKNNINFSKVLQEVLLKKANE